MRPPGPGAASRAPAEPARTLGLVGLQKGCGRWGRGEEGDRGEADEPGRAASLPPAVLSPGPAPTSLLSCNPGPQTPRPRRTVGAAAAARGSSLAPFSGTPRLPPFLPRCGPGEQTSVSLNPGHPRVLPDLPPLISAQGRESRRAPPRSPRRFSVERITPPYHGCRLLPPGKREGGRQRGRAPRRWLLSLSAALLFRSASASRAPRKERVPALRSAPARLTIAPAGSGAPASLQPRAHAGLPLPAGVPASTATPHETAAIPRLLGGGGGCVRARVCASVSVGVCLIASLLSFPSLPASVPHPRSLTHRQRGRARETHTLTRTRRLHEWAAGANPARLGESRRTGAGSRAAPRRGGAPRR